MPISSSAFTPPATLSVSEAGNAGSSTACDSTRRPADVTNANVERVVVGKIARIWSSTARLSDAERAAYTSIALGVVRAIIPVALSITTHGSSSICSAAATGASSPAFFAAAVAAATSAATDETVAASRAACSASRETEESSPFATTGASEPSGPSSSSTVRRGVPYLSTVSSISRTTTRSNSAAEARMRSSSSMRFFRSSRSASSSMRLMRVRRRRRRSRMYCACTSSRSNTAMSRFFAVSASSDVRITWITSSMSTMASSRPSTRCRRSNAFLRRNSLRRRTTTRRCSTHTCKSSFRPIA